MNDLTAGPLPARTKITLSKIVLNGKAIDNFQIYCGVRDCRERLAWSIGIVAHFCEGYQLRNGIYSKTRRSGARTQGNRDWAEFVNPEGNNGQRIKDEERGHESEIWAIKFTAKDSEIEGLIAAAEVEHKERIQDLYQRYQEKKTTRNFTLGVGCSASALPAIARCARCGRLSKITIENFSRTALEMGINSKFGSGRPRL
jgi:hypothetical protein